MALPVTGPVVSTEAIVRTTSEHPSLVSPPATVEATRLQLCAALDLVTCAFEAWPFDALLPRIERGRVVIPADEIGARSYRLWAPEDGIELPVRIYGVQIGRFVLVPRVATSGIALPVADRERALDIAEACAAALSDRFTEGASS
jgi:hypothetical protein